MAAILLKMKNNFYSFIIFSLLSVLVWNCTKDSTVSSDSLYIPKTSDITANATLQELQQGRELYISYCNSCHGLYLPEKYTPMQWKSTMTSMGPKTGLSSSDLLLITKYLCKGMQ